MSSGKPTIEAERRGAIADAVNAGGFALVPECLSIPEIEMLRAEFPEAATPKRNILAHQTIRDLASSHSVRCLAEPIIGKSCFAVRAIFFNKTPEANWRIAWHQDLTITVREKRDTPGFSSWSVKDGVAHVQPTAEILERMLAI
jgi:hypothetical protein